MSVCRQCRLKAGELLAKNTHTVLRQSNTQLPPLQARLSNHRTYSTPALAAREQQPAAVLVGGNASNKAQPTDLERLVHRQLKYLEDPWQIAEHVKRTLAKGRFDEALLLTQKASRRAKCTVSWNHLIDYQLRNQKLRSAFQLYNDMKKRAQLPDAQTYTVLFRGCAHSEHPKLAVTEAVRLYHTLLSDERLKPNVIHLNAVMEVCARAEDLDSMFSLLKTANGTFRSPDNRTYTLMLNALRRTSEQTARRPLSSEEIETDKRETLQRAKAIWQEAMARWRQGKIVVDEELVCAMGRVLLMGDRADNREVLALVEQTMKIPRPGDNAGVVIDSGPSSEEQAAVGEELVTMEQTAGKDSSSSVAGPVPRNNTLSMILKSLSLTRETSLAPWYWDLFTRTYGVAPDSDNCHELLRVLRRGRASARAADLVAQIPRQFVSPRTFKIAMSVCVRDSLNEHAFDSAGRILDLMMAAGLDPAAVPDVHTLRLYLDVALAKRQRFLELEKKGDAAGARAAHGQQIVAGLDKIWLPLKQLRAAAFPASAALAGAGREAEGGEPRGGRLYNDQREVIALARKVVAAADKVVTERMARDDVLRVLGPRRNVLNNFVVKFFDKREEREPKLAQEPTRKRSDARPPISSF